MSKEYAKGTLVHISDDAFEWFLDLEQERVNMLNKDSVAIHGDDLVEHVLSIINKNDKMKGKWHALFAGERLVPDIIPSEEEADRLVLQLFKDVVTRYVKMGVAEFLRQFRRDSKLQKTEAHRKKVVEKQKKNDLVSSKVTVQSIKKDNTLNKQNSHNRLQIMVNEQQTIFESTVYLKSEIQLLCNAYGVAFRKNDSKSKLSDKLVPLIRTCNAFPHQCTSQPERDLNRQKMKKIFYVRIKLKMLLWLKHMKERYSLKHL